MFAVAAALTCLTGCVDINVGPDEEGAHLARPEDHQICSAEENRR